MKFKPVSSVFTAVGFAVAASSLTVPQFELAGISIAGNVAYAQDSVPQPKLEGCKQAPEKRRLKSLSQSFFKKVAEVDNLTNPEVDEKTGKGPEPQYREAWPKLKKLLDRCDECNDYEWAQLYQRAAVIQYNLDNIPGAIDYFKQVVAKSPNIPESLEAQLNYQIAQLLTSEEQYRESINYFGKWESLCPNNVPKDYFYFRAQNFFQLNEKDQALKEIERAIAYAEARGEIAREPVLKMKLAILVDREDYRAAEQVGEQLAVHYTSRQAIKQLASLYGMNGKETQQMAMLDSLRVVDALESESEYRNLAYLFLGVETPFLASEVLETGLERDVVERTSKNLEVYAVALKQAQESEQAMPIMEEAARKSDEGKLYATLTAIYLDAEKFDKAVEAGRQAIKKGELRSEGEVYMYMGTAYMYLEEFDKALVELRKATKDEKYEKYARDLIKYVTNEQKRQEGLKKAAETAAS